MTTGLVDPAPRADIDAPNADKHLPAPHRSSSEPAPTSVDGPAPPKLRSEELNRVSEKMATNGGYSAVMGAVTTLLAAVSLAACGSGAAVSTHGPVTAAPIGSDVSGGRFSRSVELDKGDLQVEPVPAGLRPTVSEGVAATKIWATAELANFEAVTLGFGLVTITIRESGVPEVSSLPAWVGFAKAPTILCPNESGPTPVLPPSNGLAAVVIGAKNGLPAVVYKARTSECGDPATGPTTAIADEFVSLAWTTVGQATNASLTVRYFQPSCASPEAPTDSGNSTSMTVAINVEIPDMPEKCLPGHYAEMSVPILPFIPAGTLVDHGRVGVIREVHAA